MPPTPSVWQSIGNLVTRMLRVEDKLDAPKHVATHLPGGNAELETLPSEDEKDALAGTDGTPGAANPYVTDSDPRLSGGGGGSPWTEVEVDFGDAPYQQYREFVISDVSVDPSSKIGLSRSGSPATDKSADENEMDALGFYATPGDEEFSLHVRGLEGQLRGAFKFYYQVT